MTPLVLTVEGIVSVEYLKDILQKPFSMFPVLNSAGNIVGMMPKNILIVLIENQHWLDLKKLTQQQRQKLAKMYVGVESSEVDKYRNTLTATKKTFAGGRGIIGP
jgi:CBS domain containing-hemolysin-like protein